MSTSQVRKCASCGTGYDPVREQEPASSNMGYTEQGEYCLACWLGVGPKDFAGARYLLRNKRVPFR